MSDPMAAVELARELRWATTRARLRVSEALPVPPPVGLRRAVRVGVVTQAVLVWIVLLTQVLPVVRRSAHPPEPVGAAAYGDGTARCTQRTFTPGDRLAGVMPLAPPLWYLFHLPPRGRAPCQAPSRREESHALRG